MTHFISKEAHAIEAACQFLVFSSKIPELPEITFLIDSSMLPHSKIYTDSRLEFHFQSAPLPFSFVPPSNNITIITQMTIPSTSQPQMLLKSPNLYLEMHFHIAASYTPWATIHPGNNSITIQNIAYKGIASASKHTDSLDWNVPSVCITFTASRISKDGQTYALSDVHT